MLRRFSKATRNENSPPSDGGSSPVINVAVPPPSPPLAFYPFEDPALGEEIQVERVTSDGNRSLLTVSRRNLLGLCGLSLYEFRHLGRLYWPYNPEPLLEQCGHAVLVLLGSLRAIVLEDCVYVVFFTSKHGRQFFEALGAYMNDDNVNGVHLPFVLKVVGAALDSMVIRFGKKLDALDKRVQTVHDAPNRLVRHLMDDIHNSKWSLVKLVRKVGAVTEMLEVMENNNAVIFEENESMFQDYLTESVYYHCKAEKLLNLTEKLEGLIDVGIRSRNISLVRVSCHLSIWNRVLPLGSLVAAIFKMFMPYEGDAEYGFWATMGTIGAMVVAYFFIYSDLKAKGIL